jgi:hypothetical protein
MGLCKCRKCGEVASSKAWSAARGPACPQCGHTQFSISFPTKLQAARPTPSPVAAAVDAHGRHRKNLRLEDLVGGVPPASGKATFRERMQALKERAGQQEPGKD